VPEATIAHTLKQYRIRRIDAATVLQTLRKTPLFVAAHGAILSKSVIRCQHEAPARPARSPMRSGATGVRLRRFPMRIDDLVMR
jgi:hypothetical protein